MDGILRRRLTAAALAAALSCAAPPPTPEPGPAPPGRLEPAAYAERLARVAGGPVSVERIRRLVADGETRIERRMDRLAAQLGEPGGWRPLFERLRRATRGDGAAVLAAYRAELARGRIFVEERQLIAVPPPPPEVLALENRSLRGVFPLALYHDGRFAVTLAPPGGDDPGYLANHCDACIPPLAVHEGYPGHHVAFGRMRDAAGRLPSPAELGLYKPYVEGWALYAELLMLEEGYYTDPRVELAAWRMVLLRLARAEIDAGLHGGGLEPEAAEATYRRLLMTPDAAAAEVRGHLAKPTVKASYLVGLLQLLELRQAWRAARPRAPLSDLHDRLLGPPDTIPAIARERLGVELGRPGEAALPWPFAPPPDRVGRRSARPPAGGAAQGSRWNASTSAAQRSASSGSDQTPPLLTEEPTMKTSAAE